MTAASGRGRRAAEIFLAGFVIRFQTMFAQFADQPFRQVIPEAARIDEAVFRLG
jgi:hypothetical protein